MTVVGIPDGPTPSSLFLKVTNLAGVANETIARAQREVSLLCRDAGVKTVWIGDGDGADPANGATAVRFEIVILKESPVTEATPVIGFDTTILAT